MDTSICERVLPQEINEVMDNRLLQLRNFCQIFRITLQYTWSSPVLSRITTLMVARGCWNSFRLKIVIASPVHRLKTVGYGCAVVTPSARSQPTDENIFTCITIPHEISSFSKYPWYGRVHANSSWASLQWHYLDFITHKLSAKFSDGVASGKTLQ